MRLRFALAGLVAGLLGCPEQPTFSAPVDAEQALAADSGNSVAPYGELALEIEAQLVDGGLVTIDQKPEGPNLIEPATALSVSTNVPLRNYRVRVFDQADRVMVSDDLADDLADQLRYRIQFAEPLKTGYRYELVLDAQSGAMMTDARGRTRADLRVQLQIAGEKEKPPKKKQKKRRRR